MKALLRSSLACLLTSGMLFAQSTSTSQASTGSRSRTSRTTTARRRTAPRSTEPSTAAQLQELRDMLATQQRQIQQLQNQLAARDQQVQQAQRAATDADAKAAEAAAKAAEAQTVNSDANTQVASLKETVTAVKANDQNLAETIQSEQKRVNQEVLNPDSIHFKGITISPTGSFIEAATVWRQRGIGGDINTQFTGIPFSGASNAHLSEFNGTGRQSRLALTGEGRVGSWVARAYYEADWLSAGVTSNDNQSNSYTMRQRQLFGQIAGDNGWTFTGGQMWSLATETRTGLDNKTEVLPQTIDPQYHAGFTWARQYGARITKSFNKKVFLGFSVEQPQTLNLGGGGALDTIVYQQIGNTGGLYNNQANYSYGVAPDLIGKIAFEPGYGHYEIFGIARFFRDRVYPAATSSTVTSAAGAFNDTRNGGGIGGNIRFGLIPKKLDLGFHILAGDGVGRYGDSTLADVTVRPDGTLSPIRGGSALGGLELHATPKLDIYAYYGGDYDQRQLYTISAGKFSGYGRPTNATTGCGLEVAPAGAAGNSILGTSTSTPANCSPDTRALQEGSVGYWYDFYRGPKGRIRQSIQYSYFVKNTWAGTGGSPKAIDNMVWTAFRYYLP